MSKLTEDEYIEYMTSVVNPVDIEHYIETKTDYIEKEELND